MKCFGVIITTGVVYSLDIFQDTFQKKKTASFPLKLSLFDEYSNRRVESYQMEYIRCVGKARVKCKPVRTHVWSVPAKRNVYVVNQMNHPFPLTSTMKKKLKKIDTENCSSNQTGKFCLKVRDFIIYFSSRLPCVVWGTF